MKVDSENQEPWLQSLNHDECELLLLMRERRSMAAFLVEDSIER